MQTDRPAVTRSSHLATQMRKAEWIFLQKKIEFRVSLGFLKRLKYLMKHRIVFTASGQLLFELLFFELATYLHLSKRLIIAN